MYFKDPLNPTDKDNLFYLAPIPIYMKIFEDDVLHQKVFDLGYEILSPTQKRTQQELPGTVDSEREDVYKLNYNRQEMWTEFTEHNPIGSRFYTPLNKFLDTPDESVKTIKERCVNGFNELMYGLGFEHSNKPLMTENWIQYYDPTAGRGHNQHNHCRWGENLSNIHSFVGAYYLSDGDPILDHQYSGALCFHIRGMSHFIRPKKGMLLVWPYDIVHSVKPFYGKNERCVINFNIQALPKPNKLL
jgi:hypothetical protein